VNCHVPAYWIVGFIAGSDQKVKDREEATGSGKRSFWDIVHFCPINSKLVFTTKLIRE
jgi:hypothetical protein